MKLMHEVFEEFKSAKTREERRDVLRRNDTGDQTLRTVLQGTFHPAVQWVFKEPIEYNPSYVPVGMGYTSLAKEKEKFYIFVEGSRKVNPDLTFERKRIIALQILEALEAREAEIFMNMMMKDLKIPYLTPKLIEEAFPDLLPKEE